ncbi:MAG: glycerate kinase [Acidobacteriaceae bacterium]
MAPGRTMREPPILSGQEPLPAIARGIFASALDDCSVAKAFARAVRLEDTLDRAQALRIGDHSVALENIRRVRILAAGKAAHAMLTAMLPILPEHLDRQGIVIAPTHRRALPSGFEFFAGGHPLPNAASFAGARAAMSMLETTQPTPSDRVADLADTLWIFLISGGASAMLELPLDPAISLEETIAFHRTLVHSGASISEINCVRKHFSAVKGGRLAALTGGAACVSILISDVPHGHVDAIGSGPTVPDTTTTEDCRAILARYRLMERFPASIQQFFSLAELPETPKPGAFIAPALCLLDANELAQAALHHAEQLGFHAVIDNSCDDWDYRAATDYLLARLRVLRRIYPRVCLISAGEVTVESTDQRLLSSGIGGRNQQFALYAATRLEASDSPIAILSAGSDGIDGNSAAAGAVVDHHTLRDPGLRAAAQESLQQFCSTMFLERVGCTITTGHTGNNLRDLRLLLAESTRLTDARTSPVPSAEASLQ